MLSALKYLSKVPKKQGPFFLYEIYEFVCCPWRHPKVRVSSPVHV